MADRPKNVPTNLRQRQDEQGHDETMSIDHFAQRHRSASPISAHPAPRWSVQSPLRSRADQPVRRARSSVSRTSL